MHPQVRSTNIAAPKPDSSAKGRPTGSRKVPVDGIEVFEPGPDYGAGSGVVGDLVGNAKHHGGAQKAVYAFSREQLDHWAGVLDRDLPDGMFGENLTTSGLDLEALLINQQLRVGGALLEVSIPRSPCATFAAHLGEARWVKRFTEHGRCGVYLRVVEAGRISPGDEIELVGRPGHDVDMLVAFAAAMGDRDAARKVVAANCLPPMYHQRHVDTLRH